jgi:hypothetical protein
LKGKNSSQEVSFLIHISLLQAPIEDSILKFRWIQFILAQTGFLGYKGLLGTYDKRSEMFWLQRYAFHLTYFLCFLGIFAGCWPSGAERTSFSHNRSLEWHYAQIHFRCFALTDALDDTVGTDGLRCQRQQGEIVYSVVEPESARFRETQISIFGILSTLIGASAISDPSIFRVLILADANVAFPEEPYRLLKDGDFKLFPGSGGMVAFQGAIFLTVTVWEGEWNKVLDRIDNCLKFELKQTMVAKEIEEWMFDDDFARSRLYFTILQTLRIFGECVRSVSADLRALDSLFFSDLMTIRDPSPSHDEILAFSSNWKYVTEHQKTAEDRLLRRLLDKTEEVKSLRDGV